MKEILSLFIGLIGLGLVAQDLSAEAILKKSVATDPNGNWAALRGSCQSPCKRLIAPIGITSGAGFSSGVF